MANSYFKFKQFTIHQDECAMKVSTDSCLLGAWFAARVPQHATVLDIGSGTGLLMLMIAQKNNTRIHGIELDPSCFKQLQRNLGESNWKERITAFLGDARSFSFPEKYDFIISNPPFFENDLPSPNERNNAARHSSELSFNELIEVIDNNLSLQGSFGVLLPYARWEYFNEMAQNRYFYLRETVIIRHSLGHEFSRAVLHYSRRKESYSPQHEMSIRGSDGNYTTDFIDLLGDYYLYL